MSVSNPAIEIDHLNCAFRRNEVLHDITLSIPTGCVFGLVGLNGAGKTTLIRHLIGGLRPQSGRVRVLGEDPAQTPESVMQHVGYVAEEDALPRWMRVGELIDFMRALYRNWEPDLCDELLRQFSLDRSAKLADLSKGGRARAGLLVALAHRPQLLILDEPSYGLDPIARQDILEAVVRTVSDEGRTVLFSSHLLDEVSRVCDTVGVIGGGRLLEVIAMEELSQRYAEVVGELSPEEHSQLELPRFFGWQNRGREWSVVVDRSAYPDEAGLRQAIGGQFIHEIRPISLERWFAARVSRGEPASIPAPPAAAEVTA